MDKETLNKIMESLSKGDFNKSDDPRGTLSILINETVAYRDKLKEEYGKVLTVVDTRIALDALQAYLVSGNLTVELTPEQNELVKIWLNKLTDTNEAN